MGLFSRKNKGGPLSQRRARTITLSHLREFASTREGVAAYYERETSRAPSAIVLVAIDGEWTRRKVPSFSDAQNVAQELGISLFDVAATGYPRAMREWSARNPGSQTR
ncbi:hypothetical protein J2S70_001678 [Trueperella bonasi]|uniref:Oxidoreductase n=1 Tax=Trueperella bonasi TaxID=312286 RepID=A0ABT9NI76_9ACTO|nr:oxidoreductase [Trueperella bonasi]MDP9807096.1 hypothetical protein [Trueperella bonasi]